MSPSGETPDKRHSSVRKTTSTASSSTAQFCRAEQVAIWAYCLMPNHVHLIVVPQSAESLRRAIGEAHPRYTRWINLREGWRGHLWQGRFTSFVRERGVRARTLAPGIWREPGRLAVEYDLHVCDTSGTGTHGTAARSPPGSTAGRVASSRPATCPRLSDGRPGPTLVRTRGRMMRPCPTTHGTDSQAGPLPGRIMSTWPERDRRRGEKRKIEIEDRDWGGAGPRSRIGPNDQLVSIRDRHVLRNAW